MTSTSEQTVRTLTERVVHEAFASNPAYARWTGDHSFDGALPDVGADAVRAREEELARTAAELRAVDATRLDAEERADLGTALRVVEDELFHLRELRDPATDAQWALWRGCDASVYVSRDYAPLEERVEALVRHLEQLPQWLPEAARLLDDELAGGPRDVAVESCRGHASFYRDEIRPELGEIADATLRGRLDAAIEAAATACDEHARGLEGRRRRDDWALGGDRFCAMLAAQEGIEESIPALRARVDAEIAALTDRGNEAAGRAGAASLGKAFELMESDHTDRDGLLPAAEGMLERLRAYWVERAVVDIPEGVECTVRRSPAFFSFVTAAMESPGALEPRPLPHFYYVTPVDPSWSDEQAEQWLRHLNNASLENISVHEVFPGHFVHAIHAHRSRGLARRAFWSNGFGEGWAHYAELLAVEQGLADGRPLIELAMVQDALLRACRFSATVGMHAEGMSLAEATDLFERHAQIPRIAAEREALRGTYDPMYLVYTYGKLEILRWREELSARPGFDLRRFHDRMLGSGAPPLSVVRDYVLEGAG